jgi:hypothetical protein
MKKLLIKSSSLAIASLLALSVSNSAIAQTIDDILPDFTPEEAAEISKNFGTYTSAVAVFTGRNAASTGNFSFDNDGGDFSVTSIPITHTFGEESDVSRFRIRGGVGQFDSRISNTDFSDIYSEIESELPEEFQGLENLPDFQKDSATSLTLGGSWVYQPISGLTIEPAFDLIWTHVKRKYDTNNFVSQLVAIKFDRDIFNNSTESISYSPSLGVDYKIDLCNGYSLTPSVRYTHLWSEELWSKSQFGKFSIDSGILQTGLEANMPLGFTTFGSETSLQPFAMWTNLNNAVEEALDEDNLYDFGANFAFAVNNSWLNQLSLGAAYITASDFSGYRLNLGFDF